MPLPLIGKVAQLPKVQGFIANHLTPFLCAGAVAAYQTIEAHYPIVANGAEAVGVNGAVVNGAVIAGMAMLSNYVSRHWATWFD